MGLAEALARDVPERARTKGNRYFLGGAVLAIEGSASHVTATVRGTEYYQVHLTRTGDEVLASCGCPFFVDRNDICKHIWAVVLAADVEGFLIGDEALPKTLYLESAYSYGLDEDIADELPYGATRTYGSGRTASAPLKPWQRFLQNIQQRAEGELARPPTRRFTDGEIVYTIDAAESPGALLTTVQVLWRKRKKGGDWGKAQPLGIGTRELAFLPVERDREILSLLLGAPDPYELAGYDDWSSKGAFVLIGPLVDRVLPLLVQSGRLYFKPVETVDASRVAKRGPDAGDSSAALTKPLAWDDGEPWRFELEVQARDDGQISIDGHFVRSGERMGTGEPTALFGSGYLLSQGTVARFDAAGALSWILELRRTGTTLLPSAASPALTEALARSAIDPGVLPELLRYAVVTATPKPRIRLGRLPRQPGYGSRDELEAKVEFEYADSVLPASSDSATYDAERRHLVRRDVAAESRATERLQQLGFQRPWRAGPLDARLTISVDRFPAAVRTLVGEGWRVEAEGRLFRAAAGLQVQVTSGADWFELHGQVDFGEGRTASVVELLAALKRGDATIILDDGSRGMVPEEWLRRYARMASFGEVAGDHVRYRPSQVSLLDALLEAQPLVRVDEAFARARAQLAAFEGIRPLDPPSSFRGQLRDYQRDALGWFDFLRRFGFGGCLADDMGLGKTVMVLALLESRRAAPEPGAPRASIVVVPRSLVFNWINEAATFAPGLRVLDYTGEARAAARVEEHDLVLTTYGTLRRDAARLAAHEFDYVILDEAQAIKNPATASAKAARVLRGRHRLALSGTPIENHLGELWSLFEFLNPGFLGGAAAFGRSMASPGRADAAEVTLLGRALRPFILRRTKEQVAPELPEKIEQTIHCELEPAERRFYDELRAHYRQTLLARVARTGLNRSKIHVLEALLRLRQAASHRGLIDSSRADDSSAKFELLLERLREVVDEGHKALVFSQFTTLLGLLRPRLAAAGITYEYLDGRTVDRAARVERFTTDPRCAVFLISLKAGGVGLNLTAADYVFVLDPWWNPAVEAQAIDRTHRIGQSSHVFAYRLIARDTVEEKIAELQRSKRELADAILAEDSGFIRSLRAEDLEWLLG